MKRLIVIIHYEETMPCAKRARVTSGRCISHQGGSIPWFKIVRKVFVATVASLCREIAQREKFLEATEAA
jgi:hypothetical protein